MNEKTNEPTTQSATFTLLTDGFGAKEIPGGCLVRYAENESITFVPNVIITDDGAGGKKLSIPIAAPKKNVVKNYGKVSPPAPPPAEA